MTLTGFDGFDNTGIQIGTITICKGLQVDSKKTSDRTIKESFVLLLQCILSIYIKC